MVKKKKSWKQHSDTSRTERTVRYLLLFLLEFSRRTLLRDGPKEQHPSLYFVCPFSAQNKIFCFLLVDRDSTDVWVDPVEPEWMMRTCSSEPCGPASERCPIKDRRMNNSGQRFASATGETLINAASMRGQGEVSEATTWGGEAQECGGLIHIGPWMSLHFRCGDNLKSAGRMHSCPVPFFSF